MDRESVMADVKRKVEALPGIIAFMYLEGELREDIMRIERQAETNGACGGLMPFTNRGVWSAFERQVQFVIVGAKDAVILGISNGLVHIEDQKGQRVGEWVNAQRSEELRGNPDVYFLSEDFVFYSNVDIDGEPYFVLPNVNFPYLDGMEGVKNVVSGSVSTLADDFIRNRMGYSDTNHWTHLVGFDFSFMGPDLKGQ